MPARLSQRSWMSARSSSANCPRPKRSWPWAAAAQGRRRPTACGRWAASSCWRAPSPASNLKDLRSLADEGKKQVGSGVVAIVGLSEDGKAGIVVGVTDDLTTRFNAVDLVRKGAEVARRQRRRRPARHGAGRRSGRLQGRRRAEGDRSRAGWLSSRRHGRACPGHLDQGVTALRLLIGIAGTSPAMTDAMAQVHFTSWLREVVPDGPLQARAHGRRCARCAVQRTAACARLCARRAGPPAQARLHLCRRQAVAASGRARPRYRARIPSSMSCRLSGG